MMNKQTIESYPPIMVYHILDAVRRFEPDFYAHLCRSYHLDADRIIGLFAEVEQLGSGTLTGVLTSLRAHQAYHEIVFLAGRNTFDMWIEDSGIRKSLFASPAKQFSSSLKAVLLPFIGSATYFTMIRGTVQFIEMRNSIFSRNVEHDNPLGGFYCGFLTEYAVWCGIEHPQVIEARCCASDPEFQTCLFQISV